VESLECEVLVIGGRIAGSTLAALLGEAHHDVIVADRAAFPSPTLSTHFFRGAGGVAVLQRLGVLDQVLALGAPELACQYDYLEGEESFRLGPPQDPGEAGFCLSVRREPLDDILLRRASREPGVRVLPGTRLVELIHRDGRVVGGVLARGGDMVRVRSRFTIGADGRHSRVAAAAGAGLELSDKPARALYYQYMRGFPSPGPGPGPEFSLRGDQMAYVFPSDAGVTCVAVSVNLAAFQHIRRSLASEFPQVIAAHPGLADRFRRAEPVSRILGCGPEPYYVRQPSGPGWALAGDASIHQDPWTGAGIDFANTHATFLAEALLEVIDGHRPEAKSLADYRIRRNEHGLATYKETTELAKDLRAIPAE
jgi:flavin-dependent dehydrogenase